MAGGPDSEGRRAAADAADGEAGAAAARALRARYLDLWEETLSDWAAAPPDRSPGSGRAG